MAMTVLIFDRFAKFFRWCK